MMRWCAAAAAAVLASAAIAAAALPADAAAAGQPSTNPVAGDAGAARRGALLFRARCAGCHGLDGRGVTGPDLTAMLAAGFGDDRFLRVVRRGKGTEMPRFTEEQTSDTQVWEILTHLRTLAGAAAPAPAPGDAASGAVIFQRRCASCHKVDGRGGSLGPDLSRIGALRSPSALAAKIRNPSRSVVAGYQPVTLVLADGRRVRGVRKNEDAFSIQIMDLAERIQGFRKVDLREVIREERSAMPPFGETVLGESELSYLVTYLSTLRAAQSAPAQ
jgi:cytochrome c oxidase cbb3-type subunit 3